VYFWSGFKPRHDVIAAPNYDANSSRLADDSVSSCSYLKRDETGGLSFGNADANCFDSFARPSH
jgi:hypothetical protein